MQKITTPGNLKCRKENMKYFKNPRYIIFTIQLSCVQKCFYGNCKKQANIRKMSFQRNNCDLRQFLLYLKIMELLNNQSKELTS